MLDEATASLDAENESKIQQAISTFIATNKIIAIKNGQIAEKGKPEELKSKGGIFEKMLKAQSS